MNENTTDNPDTSPLFDTEVAAAMQREDVAFQLATAQGQVAYLSGRVAELVSEVTSLKSQLSGDNE